MKTAPGAQPTGKKTNHPDDIPTRKTRVKITVYLSPAEKRAIERMARRVNRSQSDYLRTAALGGGVSELVRTLTRVDLRMMNIQLRALLQSIEEESIDGDTNTWGRTPGRRQLVMQIRNTLQNVQQATTAIIASTEDGPVATDDVGPRKETGSPREPARAEEEPSEADAA